MNIVCDCELRDQYEGPCEICGMGKELIIPPREPEKKQESLKANLNSEQISYLIKSGFRF